VFVDVAVMANKGVVRSLSDIHDTVCALEVGSSLTRYFRNKRPETRMFRVLLETRELTWMRSSGGKAEGVGMFCGHVFVIRRSTITLLCYRIKEIKLNGLLKPTLKKGMFNRLS